MIVFSGEMRMSIFFVANYVYNDDPYGISGIPSRVTMGFLSKTAPILEDLRGTPMTGGNLHIGIIVL